jgi:hypothetical protein
MNGIEIRELFEMLKNIPDSTSRTSIGRNPRAASPAFILRSVKEYI